MYKNFLCVCVYIYVYIYIYIHTHSHTKFFFKCSSFKNSLNFFLLLFNLHDKSQILSLVLLTNPPNG